MKCTATTVSQFLECVRDVRKRFRFSNDDPWGPWFRGQTEAQWDLRPRLYREYGGFRLVRKQCIEEAMREEFMVRAPALGLTTPYGDEKRAEWQWYFTMQHFGTPTRLLDWTDGALIALHFAVKDNRGLYDAAVWALDPYALNERVFSRRMMGKTMIVVPPSLIGLSKRLRRQVDRWLPSLEQGIGVLPKKPIAILPTHTERRISTQRSCFTIHGADEDGLDALWTKTSKHLAKIVIPASRVQAVRRELDAAGIDEATIYPDMGGLSRTISDRWKKDGHPLPHHRVYTRLRPSRVHGVGVFALVPIKKGELIFDGENREMPWFEEESLPRTPKEIRELYDDFAVVGPDDRYGCPVSFNRLNPSWYLNEPRDGQKPNVNGDPETFEFRAARNIRPGEELTTLYRPYSKAPLLATKKKPSR